MLLLNWATIGPLAALVALAAGEGRPGTEQWPHQPRYVTLPTLREQAAIQDAWVKERRDAIPKLLHKHGVDAWLVSQKEYAEETVFWSLKRAQQFSARRRTTSIFFANATKGESSYTWIDNTPQLWDNLRAVLEAENPAVIAVNADTQIAFSSGLHAGELKAISDGIGRQWVKRMVSRPMLGVEYIATQIESRWPWYYRLQSTAWAIIDEGFSARVITPGKTTTEDVEWWMREKIQQMNYTTWFHPSVTIVDARSTWQIIPNSTSGTVPDPDIGTGVINYGDYLHVDFGVTALGLNTDTQHLGYVLRPGQTEDDVPAGLREGLKKGNRIQDILISHMEVGKSGNEILAASLKQMVAEGIEGKIYSHPIGDWGHSAGTLIGMTNLQDGVPTLGELPLLPNTYYSVELSAYHYVPEYNATLIFPLEEDIWWVPEENAWRWVYGQQQKFHVVKTPAAPGLQVQMDDL